MSARLRLARAITRSVASFALLAAWPTVANAAAPGPALAATVASLSLGGESEIPLQRPIGMEAATLDAAPHSPTSSPAPAPAAAAPTAASPAAPPNPSTAPASPPSSSGRPTSSPAPASAQVQPQPQPRPVPKPSPRDAEAASDPGSSSPQATSAAEGDDREQFPHAGTVLDFRLGTLGCIGAFCRDNGHDVSPGIRLGGFLGGNIRGWFEMGLGGAWGTMNPNVTPGTNALVLYGLDPGILQQALAAQAAGILNVDLAGLAVQDAQLRDLQVGPSMRVHLVPRGRFDAFIGAGVGYHRLRSQYETGVGNVRLDFHGIDVPVEANVSVYVLRNLAVGVQFDYMWTWYGLAVLDHPEQRLAMPMGVLQAAAAQQGVDLRGQLPQLWTVGLALRGRL